MRHIRYLLITVALLMFATWASHGYRNGVLDSEFLAYGQSKIAPGPVNIPIAKPPFEMTPQNPNAITLERSAAGPFYLLRIDLSGGVFFRPGPPSNRNGLQTATITSSQVSDLVAALGTIHFFELNDVYPETSTDGPATSLSVTLDGKTKTIKHFDTAPAGLEEFERTLERTVNIHRWLHRDTNRMSLQSPPSGDGEDLTNESQVSQDVEARIKPGMTPLMQTAGGRGIKAEVREAQRRMVRVSDSEQDLWSAAKVRQLLQQGEDVNAADESGWTALMIAAVKGQPQCVSMLLGSGARVDQRDRHGNTALIGAASVRYRDLHIAAEVVGILLAHSASVDARNDLGESALMWAARVGNPESIQALLKAGANSTIVDKAGHDALFYLRDARDHLPSDPAQIQRYNKAEALLK